MKTEPLTPKGRAELTPVVAQYQGVLPQLIQDATRTLAVIAESLGCPVRSVAS